MRMAARGLVAAMAVLLGAAVDPPPEAQRMVPGERDGYVTDGKGGCWIWMGGMPSRAEDVTTAWSGPCPAGPAEGEGTSIMRWHEAGHDREMVFEGSLLRGKAEGQGKLVHRRDGQVIQTEQGSYEDDRFIAGRVEIPSAGLVYEGEWRLNDPHGQGRLSVRGQVFQGIWDQGCLRVGNAWIAFTRPPASCDATPT